MGKVDYGDSGIEEVLVVDPRGLTEVPLGDLADNEFTINHRKPVLRVVLAGGKKKGQKVAVTQRLGGQELPAKAVKARKDNRFELVTGLFRGRNDLIVTVGENEPFHFRLIHRSVLLEWVVSLLQALILVVVVKTFVVQAFFIPTGSMEDTLYPSDYILVEKVSGLFNRPKNGDVIVFQYPMDPTKDYIKRKVADQGDTIAIRAKQLYRGSECLDETEFAVHKDDRYIMPGPYEAAKRDTLPPMVIPPKHSYAMGDNRDNSQDSRFWGALPDYRLKGRALAIYWPPTRIRAIYPQVGVPKPAGDCPEVLREFP